MDNREILIVVIVLALAAVFLFVWMRRDRGKEPEDRLPEALSEKLDGRSGAIPIPAPIVSTPVDVVATAVDVPPPAVRPAPEGPPDDLSRMKGVGPKLVALLHELGVTHFSQIAAWTDEDVAAIDQHLGAFRGRIMRDRWVEQARRLATDDISGFEAQFGKLG